MKAGNPKNGNTTYFIFTRTINNKWLFSFGCPFNSGNVVVVLMMIPNLSQNYSLDKGAILVYSLFHCHFK